MALPMPLATRELGRQGRVDVAYVTLDEGADIPTVQAAIEEVLPEEHRVLDASTHRR